VKLYIERSSTGIGEALCRAKPLGIGDTFGYDENIGRLPLAMHKRAKLYIEQSSM